MVLGLSEFDKMDVRWHAMNFGDERMKLYILGTCFKNRESISKNPENVYSTGYKNTETLLTSPWFVS